MALTMELFTTNGRGANGSNCVCVCACALVPHVERMKGNDGIIEARSD